MAAAASGAALYAVRVSAVDADPAKLSTAIRSAFGDRPIVQQRVNVELPTLAENGLVVPITVSVESPMTAADHVSRIQLFAERNNLAEIAAFELGPHNGIAKVSTRIRLAESQQILAIAETSDGRLWSGAARVEVTISGCG
ncbi:MAG: sulfur oxidation protein SoxY [Burkholderiales bacterium]|nr:sulfur oxidation protein SoxY [Burkholderiales bacterium]